MRALTEREIRKRLGAEGDVANATGSLHARLEELDAAMAGVAPLSGSGRVRQYPTSNEVLPANPQSGAVAWTFGAWVECWPAATHAVDLLAVGMQQSATAEDLSILQWGTGGSGAEVALASRPQRWPTARSSQIQRIIPFLIPANARLAVRASSGATSAVIFGVYLWLLTAA